MECSSSLLHEVSSDEKKGIGGRFADGVYLDWLAELLGEVDKVKDDTDNVELMSGVFPIPTKSRLPSPKPTIDNDCDDEDDDCVVLDGDPDKPTAVVNVTADNDDNSDDLMVVGEKGQVACRDFPHPRHLCAKFLFATTSHDVHCSQCHCYVCDSLAPCAYWGTGIHSSDHCHASDKEEYWSAQRRSMKERDKPVQFLSTFNNVSFSETLPETTQVPAFLQPRPNPLLPNDQVLRPVGVPNVLNQGRRHVYGCVFPRHNAQTQLASQQLCNRMLTSRDSSCIPGHIGPQLSPPHAVFKRPGSRGDSPNNRHGNAKNYGSQLSRDPVLKRWHTPMLNSCHGSNLQNIGSLASSFVLPQQKLSLPQSMDVGRANYLPSRPQIHSQPYSSCLARDPIPCQPQSPSQTVGSSNFLSEVHLQPQVASQPNVGNFMNRITPQPNSHIPSQTFISNRSNAGNDFENQRHNQTLTSSHPNMDISFENQGSQPQSSGTPICTFVDGQNNHQQGIRTQNGLYTSMKDFSFDWDGSCSHGNLQIQADDSRYQTAKNDDHWESTSPLNNPSIIDDIDCHYPVSTNHDSLDFQLGSWVFENHSLPEAVDAIASPGFDAFSPEPACLYEDTLFYF